MFANEDKNASIKFLFVGSETLFSKIKFSLKDIYQLDYCYSIEKVKHRLLKEDIQILIIELSFFTENNNISWETFLNHEVLCLNLAIVNGNYSFTLVDLINSGLINGFISQNKLQEKLNSTIEKLLLQKMKRKSEQDSVINLHNLYHQMNFLHEISQKISEKKPLPELFMEIMESSKLIMNAEASSLLLFNEYDQKLYFHTVTGDKNKLVSQYSIELGTGIAGWVAQNMESVVIEDCYMDARFNPEVDKNTYFRTKSMICVPLIRKNKLLGVMQVINKKSGQAFQESDLTVFETLALQCAIAIENARLIEIEINQESLEREMKIAKKIQEKLLPETLPEYADIQVAATLVPAKQVGGDFYNIVNLNSQQSFFCIADVTGKSVPAALIVSTIYSCLQTYLTLNKSHFNIIEFVESLNKIFLVSSKTNKYATFWCGLYNHETRVLSTVNAGHNYPFLYRFEKKDIYELKIGGLILGFLDEPYFKEDIQLNDNDILVFYTDGVVEALNEVKEMYGEERFENLIANNNNLNAEELLLKIQTDVAKHVGDAAQYDDFTCVVLRVLKKN